MDLFTVGRIFRLPSGRSVQVQYFMRGRGIVGCAYIENGMLGAEVHFDSQWLYLYGRMNHNVGAMT